MKSKKCINSGKNDCITIIASAAKDTPGHIRIWSGNFMKEKQFRYSKCEIFTADIPKEEAFQVSMQDVKFHYGYLFQKGTAAPVQQLDLENEGDVSYRPLPEKTYKNQNEFHYTPPVGWLNDPVGLCFYQGLYHMFYQFNPASQQWGDMHWGHATSRDLLHWRNHPVVLGPQPELICNPSVRGGAFSGSALIEQDKMHLFFTRHIGDMEKKHCMEYTSTVSSKDGFTFSREQRAVEDLPADLGENFRDPMVWREGGKWLMLTGTETNVNGESSAAVSIHSSGDLVNWEYKGIFFLEKNRRYLRAECPSIRKIAGKYVLIVGYHNRDEKEIRRDTVYYIGSLKGYQFHAECGGLLDYGKDFYAAQMFANLKEPTLLAWVNDRYEYHIEKLCRSNGTMSLPRKLWIEDGKLYSYPVDEVKSIETKEASFGNAFSIQDGRGHLHIDLGDNPSGHVILAGSRAGQVSLAVSGDRVTIQIDEEKWETKIKIKELDIYTDNSLLEIFLNHGRKAFTRRYERHETNYQVNARLSCGCKAVFSRIAGTAL